MAEFAVASTCKRQTQRYNLGADPRGFPGFPAGLWDHGMEYLNLGLMQISWLHGCLNWTMFEGESLVWRRCLCITWSEGMML